VLIGRGWPSQISGAAHLILGIDSNERTGDNRRQAVQQLAGDISWRPVSITKKN
jgi:hypothetical protein